MRERKDFIKKKGKEKNVPQLFQVSDRDAKDSSHASS